MDYSKFLDESFEPKDWINSAFRSNKDSGVTNDQYATTLVMKLQLLVQEVNNVIEETSREVVSNLPRVLRDVEAIKQEASLLQDQMKHIKQDVQKVEQDTSKSMQALLQLDAIKSRMEQTAEALQQADKWTVLSSEIEDVIQSGDGDLLTVKLVAMQQSLRLLVNVPDYDDRCQHLEALKNRLESLVSPNIVTAFTNGSQEETRHYVEMFESIDRLEQMRRYYEHFHKSALNKCWTEQCESTDKPLPLTLSLFYETVMSTFHTQVSWCSGVFDEPVKVVCQMLAVSLEWMEKAMSSSISQHLESQDSALHALSQLKQVTDKFADTLEMSLVERLQAGDINTETVVKMARAVYEPYLPYVKEYHKLECHYIKEELDNIEMEDRRYIDSSINKLSASVGEVFKVARAVYSRCSLLTAGVGYLSISEIYSQYFSNYSTEVKRIIVNFGEKFKGQPEDQIELDSWAMFSYALQIIQVTGDIIAEIEELDETVVGDILLVTDKLSTKAASPLTDMRVIYQLLPQQILQLEQLRETVFDKQSVLTLSLKLLRSLSEHAHKLAFDSVFSQIDKHLHLLSESEVWVSQSAGGALTTDLPTFSLSPQEYITQIGQYIMTLPQYLDPFTSETLVGSNSTSMSIQLAVKYGRLPYTKLDKGDQLDSLWLESVSRATMHTYCDEILHIPEISAHATKQLITDIEYFMNILDDLGLEPIDKLSAIEDLLKASPADYDSVSDKLPKSISSTIKAMRHIDV